MGVYQNDMTHPHWHWTLMKQNIKFYLAAQDYKNEVFYKK